VFECILSICYDYIVSRFYAIVSLLLYSVVNIPCEFFMYTTYLLMHMWSRVTVGTGSREYVLIGHIKITEQSTIIQHSPINNQWTNHCIAVTAIEWLVHWSLMGGLLNLYIQREGVWADCGPAQSSYSCTKCNSPPINGQCANFILFDLAL